MKNEKNVKKYAEPELEAIYLNEDDVISTSGGEEIPQEGEFIPMAQGGTSI